MDINSETTKYFIYIFYKDNFLVYSMLWLQKSNAYLFRLYISIQDNVAYDFV